MNKSEICNQKIKQRILKEADPDYKKFSASLIPNIDNILGVRLPTCLLYTSNGNFALILLI